MFTQKKKPFDLLEIKGAFYDLTVIQYDYFGIENKKKIRGELRGWHYDDDHGVSSVLIWEMGDTAAEQYFEDDIVAVTPIEKPFFTPFKGREVQFSKKVDVYRNLHTNNGYSIRCTKTGLVLAHCTSVHMKNATFHVSESGRQKTINEKRKRVHAFVRGELVSYNTPVPDYFLKVVYNPYYNSAFTVAETNAPVYAAEEVICSGKYAYASSITKGEGML